MNAIQVKQFGGPEVLEYTSLDTPSPESDQVLIRVKCIGVNFADVKARLGAYHGKYRLPFVPGLDALSTVEKTGSAVQHLRPWPRVTAPIMSDLILLIAEKRIRPVICKQYPLPEAAQAHRDLESRLYKGKTLLNVQ